jgi:hypothetical protein
MNILQGCETKKEDHRSAEQFVGEG